MIEELFFLAENPGGMDVILPIYDWFKCENKYKVFFCYAGHHIYNEYSYNDSEIILLLNDKIKNNRKFILITGTSLPTGIELKSINLCHRARIGTISILDYWSNYSNRFKLSNSTIFPDKLFVMDEISYEEAIKDGIPHEIIKIVGHPGLDRYVNLRDLKNGMNKDGICFLSQPLSMLYGDKLGFNEITVIPDIINLANELNIKFSVKFHPRETSYMMNKYEYCSTNEEVDEIAKNYRWVIGMNTMAMLKAYIMGEAEVICYEPGLKGEDFCICNKLKLTKRLNSYSEIKDVILNNESNKYIPDVKRLLWMDGKSVYRCVSEIKRIIGIYEL